MTAIKARLLPHKGLQSGYLRIMAEVPAEEAASVTSSLGWPSPSEEIWVAIVRIKPEAESKPDDLPDYLKVKE